MPEALPPRIIFLDFDGVLNNWDWLGKQQEHLAEPIKHFDPECVTRLNAICERTKAKVILSTSWRLMFPHETLIWLLEHVGARVDVIGQTPRPRFSDNRWDEIFHWLTDTKYDGRYAVLDDDVREYEMHDYRDRLVRTSLAHGGLLPEHVERACAILGEGDK